MDNTSACGIPGATICGVCIKIKYSWGAINEYTCAKKPGQKSVSRISKNAHGYVPDFRRHGIRVRGDLAGCVWRSRHSTHQRSRCAIDFGVRIADTHSFGYTNTDSTEINILRN
ncbi:MAG TPA: hypothetical protein VJQ60_16560 [Arthrobacter sp.]|nr:hypothetical protein [Arthrobacter sp.]